MHFLPHENEESLKRSFKPDTFSTPFKPAYESNSRHLNSQSNDSWQNPLEKTREPEKKKRKKKKNDLFSQIDIKVESNVQ